MKEFEMEVEFGFKTKLTIKAETQVEAMKKLYEGVTMTVGTISSEIGEDLVSQEVDKEPNKYLWQTKEVGK